MVTLTFSGEPVDTGRRAVAVAILADAITQHMVERENEKGVGFVSASVGMIAEFAGKGAAA